MMTATADQEHRVRTADAAGATEDPPSMPLTALESRGRPPLPSGPESPPGAPGKPLRGLTADAPGHGRLSDAPSFGPPEVLS
ncbi:hypothetical protein OG866_34335 [Streptomyces sp. NBC_00663]|uniref:hypothetical protein n=1 Tax=Streptomyces sp. NBC_00663 TaxID=2975801 RepID=UPI002E334060|nr:hypothetical protein [Streptomyces sp. NBC_00663]